MSEKLPFSYTRDNTLAYHKHNTFDFESSSELNNVTELPLDVCYTFHDGSKLKFLKETVTYSEVHKTVANKLKQLLREWKLNNV
jgi:hypothetical protein